MRGELGEWSVIFMVIRKNSMTKKLIYAIFMGGACVFLASGGSTKMDRKISEKDIVDIAKALSQSRQKGENLIGKNYTELIKAAKGEISKPYGNVGEIEIKSNKDSFIIYFNSTTALNDEKFSKILGQPHFSEIEDAKTQHAEFYDLTAGKNICRILSVVDEAAVDDNTGNIKRVSITCSYP